MWMLLLPMDLQARRMANRGAAVSPVPLRTTARSLAIAQD
jgi:hypothetical protein